MAIKSLLDVCKIGCVKRLRLHMLYLARGVIKFLVVMWRETFIRYVNNVYIHED